MSSDIHIQPSTVTVQQFFLQDGTTSVPAMELLGAVMELTSTYKPLKSLDVSDTVIQYLQENKYMTVEDGMYDVTNAQRHRCALLGNRVSRVLDDQIAQLPEGTKVKIPQILAVHGTGQLIRAATPADEQPEDSN